MLQSAGKPKSSPNIRQKSMKRRYLTVFDISPLSVHHYITPFCICNILDLPNELIEQICMSCDAPDLVSLSLTSSKFYHLVCQIATCWKRLCESDFDIQLTSFGKFPSYRELYKYLYYSRILMGCYTYGRYFEGLKPKIPNWLMHWASLSRQMPTMKYGKDRVRGRVIYFIIYTFYCFKKSKTFHLYVRFQVFLFAIMNFLTCSKNFWSEEIPSTFLRKDRQTNYLNLL